MSFSASSNGNSHCRNDGIWDNAGQNGYTRSNIGAKLDNYLDRKELPMYKDKPYNYASSGRKPSYRKWRFTLGVLLLLVVLLYWVGMFSSPSKAKAKVKDTGKGTWSWLNKPAPGKVDWNERRERVKEAFTLTWDGYEKYAWGEFAPTRLYCTFGKVLQKQGCGRLIVGQATINTCRSPRKAIR